VFRTGIPAAREHPHIWGLGPQPAPTPSSAAREHPPCLGPGCLSSPAARKHPPHLGPVHPSSPTLPLAARPLGRGQGRDGNGTPAVPSGSSAPRGPLLGRQERRGAVGDSPEYTSPGNSSPGHTSPGQTSQVCTPTGAPVPPHPPPPPPPLSLPPSSSPWLAPGGCGHRCHR